MLKSKKNLFVNKHQFTNYNILYFNKYNLKVYLAWKYLENYKMTVNASAFFVN